MNPNIICIGIALALTAWLPICARAASLRATLLHNSCWAVALFIVGSGLINYDEISLTTLAIIGLSIVAFNAAVAVGFRLRTSHPDSKAATSACREMNPLVTLAIYRLILLAFCAGIAVYLFQIHQSFGLSTLFSNPTSIRASRTIRYLEEFPAYGKALVYMGPLCFVLTAFPFLVKRSRPQRAYVRLGLLVAVLALQALLLQRTNIFVCLMWAAGIVLVRSRSNTERQSFKYRRLVVFAFIGLLAFQGIAVLLGKTGVENTAVSSSVGTSLAGSQVTGVLVYASSGVPAFDKLVRSTNPSWPSEATGTVYGDFNPPTNGLATFSAVTSHLPFDPNWKEVSPFVFTPVPTNVFTWLEPWYRDFQVWGILLAISAIGLLLGQLCHGASQKPEALLFAGLLVGFSGLAGFNNRYGSTMSIVLYAIIILLGRLRAGREGRTQRVRPLETRLLLGTPQSAASAAPARRPS